jgi:hypothetical protein
MCSHAFPPEVDQEEFDKIFEQFSKHCSELPDTVEFPQFQQLVKQLFPAAEPICQQLFHVRRTAVLNTRIVT